jgi:uncharacterized protein YecE (DUF72 family)
MVHVGTCSWTEKTLLQSGEFYPKGITTAEARLKFYAQNFDTVEVDSSYYAIPDTRTTQLWADRTPDEFIFHIKAYGALTGHAVDPKSLPVDIAASLPIEEREKKHVYVKEPSLLKITAERFREALKPLAEAKKLGVVVFQFPPWFQYRRSNLDHILKAQELMGSLPVAVEFRHGSWLTPEKRASVIHFLREYRLVYVTADEPQYGSLATIPFLPDVTASIGYFRFHGRNKENWLKKGIETSLRFDYEYSEKELKDFVPAIKEAQMSSEETYVLFNNCHGAKAVRNAKKMQPIIQRAL